MAQQVINNTTNPDNLFELTEKCNSNFEELYAVVVPTLTSELTNDSGFLTDADLPTTFDKDQIIGLEQELIDIKADVQKTEDSVTTVETSIEEINRTLSTQNTALANMNTLISNQNFIIANLQQRILDLENN